MKLFQVEGTDCRVGDPQGHAERFVFQVTAEDQGAANAATREYRHKLGRFHVVIDATFAVWG